MNTNVLKAMTNLSKLKSFKLPIGFAGSNKITSAGVALEIFVKDAFCNSFEVTDDVGKLVRHRQYLSYAGNANNPPDFIVNGGDAIEVKKRMSADSELALNSSYPKDKLYSDDPLITDECRNCESKKWNTKDFIYAVGAIERDEIKSLMFVYGDCYAADRKVYQKTKEKIIAHVKNTPGLDFSLTRELGRVNAVDPLGITYLRIRGMWGIVSPTVLFSALNLKNDEGKPLIAALMLLSKYNSFPDEDKIEIQKVSKRFEEVDIANPNNPMKMLKAVLIIV